MTAPTKRRVGERVSVNHPKYPGVWIVSSNGPVNATLTPEAGGRGLRVPHTMLIDAGEQPRVPEPTSVSQLLSPGELMRVPTGRYSGLYVVIADRGADKVNLARLGGENGRYLRISRYGLVKVNPEEVLK